MLAIDDWVGWAQVAVAIVALIAGSASIGATWQRLKYRFVVTSFPQNVTLRGHAQSWHLLLQNKTRAMRTVTMKIYPENANNRIIHCRVITPLDGGVEAHIKAPGKPAADLEIIRIAPKREVMIFVIFERPGIPACHCETHYVKQLAEIQDVNGRISREAVLMVSRLRFMMLALLFCLGYGYIVFTIVYQGFFGTSR